MAQKLNIFSGRQFLDANGDPYSAALLFVYTAGSSTKATVTKDSAGVSAHANPIVLNSRGEPADGSGASQAIWQTEGSALKFVLAPSTDTDPPIAAISSWDNLAGINDTTTTIDQWVNGNTPTYVDATSFTLVGDQTSDFHVGRRLKTTNTGGTIYSTIITSAYTSLSTITVTNDSGTLDSGLSAVSYAVLSSTNPSVPNKIVGSDVASAAALSLGGGDFFDITGTTAITSIDSRGKGSKVTLQFDGILTLTHHATNLILPSGANITTAAGDIAVFYEYASGDWRCTNYSAATGKAVSSGGSIILLSTKPASASPSLDFTSSIDSTYSSYMFVMDEIRPATDGANLRMLFSTDGGSTWITTASYKWIWEGRTTTGGNFAADASAGYMTLSQDIGSAAGEALTGEITVNNPSSTTNFKLYRGQMSFTDSAGLFSLMSCGGGYFVAATDIDAIQFLFNSGNIAAGSIRMYGIKNA